MALATKTISTSMPQRKSDGLLASFRASRLDGPGCSDIAEADGRGDRRAFHEPDREIAAAVDPEKVAVTVAIEIASLSDLPRAADRNGADCPGRLNLPAAVEEPDRDCAAGAIAEQNVGNAITVEIAKTLHHPIACDAADAAGLER